MTYTLRGEVYHISPTQQISDKFRKREIIIYQQEQQFENFIKVEFSNHKCESIDSLSKGDEVIIDFALSGRAWFNKEKNETQYFTTLRGLGFTKEDINGGNDGNFGSVSVGVGHVPQAKSTLVVDSTQKDKDDLPF